MKKFKLWILILSNFTLTIYVKNDIKQAHLSDEWYPGNPLKLKKMLAELDVKAEKNYKADISCARVLIVPHGGLSYSGSLSAACFRLIDPKKAQKIIVLAPCHSMPFCGVLLPSYSSYHLNSGTIFVDKKIIHALHNFGMPFFKAKHEKEDPHHKEHTLEIELPFIQKYAPHAKIVPLFVGVLDEKEAQVAAKKLKKYIDDKTIIVVSSDFTHYGPRFDNVPFKNDEIAFFKIRSLDNKLLQPIFHRSLKDFLETVSAPDISLCGKSPLSLLLALFQEGVFKDEIPYLIGYEASDYIKKDRYNRVSFVGMVFAKPPLDNKVVLTQYEKRSLDQCAYDSLKYADNSSVKKELFYPIMSPALEKSAQLCLGNQKNTVNV